MAGVMSAAEAIDLAHRKGLDLVEIAPKAQPPTCKIMDYGKWKFDLKKKEKLTKKKQVKMAVKEIQVRPRTDEFDLNVKIKKAREFLLSGHKVKLHLRFSGRELAHKNIGIDMIDRVSERLKDLCLEDIERSNMEKRSIFALFSPDPVQVKEHKNKTPKKPENPAKKNEELKSKPKTGQTSKK